MFKKSVYRQATPNPIGLSLRLSDMEIARSTCSNGLVWQDLWLAEYRLLGSQNAVVTLQNATTISSHDSGHTMELRLQLDPSTPAPISRVCGKGTALKPEPCSGSRS